jgi:hypothetical protein
MAILIVVITVAFLGVIFALRFNVLVLIPALMMVLAITLPLASNEISSTLITVFLAITALEVGYLAGAVIRRTRLFLQSPLSTARPLLEKVRPSHRTHNARS